MKTIWQTARDENGHQIRIDGIGRQRRVEVPDDYVEPPLKPKMVRFVHNEQLHEVPLYKVIDGVKARMREIDREKRNRRRRRR